MPRRHSGARPTSAWRSSWRDVDIELSTRVPVNVTGVLGSGRFRLQNRGPVAVYRSPSATMPNIDLTKGFRHEKGSVWEVSLLDDPSWWEMWLWADSLATVAAEPAVW